MQSSRICLETDIVFDIGSVPCNRYHSHQVLETRAVLSVVDDTMLSFGVIVDLFPELAQSIVIGAFPFDPPTRELQESAISA